MSGPARKEREACPHCRGSTTEIADGEWMCLECSTRFTFDVRGRPTISRTSIPPKATLEYLLIRGNALMVERTKRVDDWKKRAKEHRDDISSIDSEWNDIQAAIRRHNRENQDEQ